MRTPQRIALLATLFGALGLFVSSAPCAAKSKLQAASFGGMTVYAREKPRRDDKPPSVVVKEPTVGPKGPIDEAVLRRVFMRSSLEALRSCYLRALQDAPNLSGIVTVRFIIALDGHVWSADVTGGIAPALDSCVVGEVKKGEFPRPQGGAIVVTYPFAFKPEPS